MANQPNTYYVIAGSMFAAEQLARHVMQNDMRALYHDEAAVISAWLGMPQRARYDNFPYKVRLMRTDDTIIATTRRRLRSWTEAHGEKIEFVANRA
jgi:hypothetical protein